MIGRFFGKGKRGFWVFAGLGGFGFGGGYFGGVGFDARGFRLGLFRDGPCGASLGYYVVLLFDPDIPRPTRTGLSIKGQDLVYKVTRYGGKQGGSFVDEREIHCGSIDWKNLVRMQ
jgi:hypothetical protein